MSNYPRIFVALAAATTLVACGKSAPTTLSLTGDSVIHVAKMTFPNGMQSGECDFSLIATATGDKGDSARVLRGRAIYTFQQTGDTLMKMPIEGQALTAFLGGNNTIAVGTPLTSKRQGLSVSLPANPMRGSVTLDYTTSSAKDTSTTQPYTFVCR